MKTGILLVLLVACGKSADSPAKDPPKPTPPPAIDAAVARAPDAAPAGSGSAVAAAGPRGPKAVIGTVPDGWTPDEDPPDQMTLLVATNETAYPVDNALFSVRYGLEDTAAPVKDPKAYAAWLEKTHAFKATKTQAVPRGRYFESKDAFRYLLESDGAHVWCGGSLYKTTDYNKIPKIRDASVAAGKKLCASVKAG